MSAASAAWDTIPAVVVGHGPRRADGRADLRLVHPRAAVPAARLRVTRFGRLLLVLGVVAVAAALAVTVLGAGPASATIDHTITVTSGDTLSAIAATSSPQVAVAEGVAQIQLANDLSSSQVHAGQRLAIPAVG